MSLKQTILDYLKSQYPRVVHKGEIGRKAVLEWGYENENAGRRCRELEEAGLIEKVPHPKGEAQYRLKQDSAPQSMIPSKQVDKCVKDYKCYWRRKFGSCYCVPEPKVEKQEARQTLF